jgi:hypothetical protein
MRERVTVNVIKKQSHTHNNGKNLKPLIYWLAENFLIGVNLGNN